MHSREFSKQANLQVAKNMRAAWVFQREIFRLKMPRIVRYYVLAGHPRVGLGDADVCRAAARSCGWPRLTYSELRNSYKLYIFHSLLSLPKLSKSGSICERLLLLKLGTTIKCARLEKHVD